MLSYLNNVALYFCPTGHHHSFHLKLIHDIFLSNLATTLHDLNLIRSEVCTTMWMMGCSSDNSSSSFSDSYKPRNLRPVIHQKPHLFPTSTTSSNTTSSHSWLSLSNDEEPSSILHSQFGGEQRRLELGVQGSSRWNPTPEQLRFLEDLYRRGTRTPTTEQIQHMTAKLRRYGKIEGKNIFYWFQNHKARERQKCRRRIEAATELLDCYLQRKDSASYLIGFEQCKDLVTTNCGIRHEEPILFSRGERVQNPSQRLWKNSLQFVEDHNITDHQQNPNIRTSGNSSPATSPIYKEANSEGQAIETLQLFPLHSDATTFTPTTNNSLTNPKSSHAHYDLIPFFQFL